MNSFKTKNPSLYRKFKREWKLFLCDSLKLSHKRNYCHSFKYLISPDEKLDYLLKQNEILAKDYNLYQYLLGSIQSSNYQNFFRKIDELGKEISHYMKTVLKTLKKYKEYVSNTLLTTYNNGMIEGTNNLIKNVKRFPFGYRYFSNFRKHIMIIKGLIDINTCNI